MLRDPLEERLDLRSPGSAFASEPAAGAFATFVAEPPLRTTASTMTTASATTAAAPIRRTRGEAWRERVPGVPGCVRSSLLRLPLGMGLSSSSRSETE